MRMYALWAAVSYPRDVCNAIDAGSNADDSAPPRAIVRGRRRVVEPQYLRAPAAALQIPGNGARATSR